MSYSLKKILCSIDFEKVFDNMRNKKCLKSWSSGINDKDLRIIFNLYWGQTAKIRLEQHFSEEIDIKKAYDNVAYSPPCFSTSIQK